MIFCIIPTPQISLFVKQFCLGVFGLWYLSYTFCSVLYSTADTPLSICYHLDNESCDLWRQCVPGGLLLIWYYSAGEVGCQDIIRDLKVTQEDFYRIYGHLYGLIQFQRE